MHKNNMPTIDLNGQRFELKQPKETPMTEVLDTPATATDITTLPVADRAALVLNSTKTEADLKQLAKSLKAITLVNSPAGREQAHALAMTARTARTTIEKAGKSARDDATKFSKAVIAEEYRLIEIIQPEETRVLGLRNAWDAAEAADADIKAEAEMLAQSIAEQQARKAEAEKPAEVPAATPVNNPSDALAHVMTGVTPSLTDDGLTQQLGFTRAATEKAALRAEKLFEAYGEDAEHITAEVATELIDDVIEFCKLKGIDLPYSKFVSEK